MIHDLNSKNYEFSCLVDSDDLSDSDKAALGVTENELLEVTGYFTIDWDDDIAMVVLESCYIDNGNKHIPGDSALTSRIEDKIQDSGEELQWFADRIASETDKYESWDR